MMYNSYPESNQVSIRNGDANPRLVGEDFGELRSSRLPSLNQSAAISNLDLQDKESLGPQI